MNIRRWVTGMLGLGLLVGLMLSGGCMHNAYWGGERAFIVIDADTGRTIDGSVAAVMWYGEFAHTHYGHSPQVPDQELIARTDFAFFRGPSPVAAALPERRSLQVMGLGNTWRTSNWLILAEGYCPRWYDTWLDAAHDADTGTPKRTREPLMSLQRETISFDALIDGEIMIILRDIVDRQAFTPAETQFVLQCFVDQQTAWEIAWGSDARRSIYYTAKGWEDSQASIDAAEMRVAASRANVQQINAWLEQLDAE